MSLIIRIKSLPRFLLLVFFFSTGGVCFAQDPVAKRDFDEGQMHLNAGNYNQAIESFRMAVSLEEDYTDAYVEMGVAYKKKGDFDKAITYLEKAVSMGGNVFEPVYLSDAFTHLGAIYLKKGNFDRALKYLKQAVFINPNSSLAYNNLGLFYLSRGFLDKAIDNFYKAISLNPDSSNEAHYNLAIVYERKRNILAGKPMDKDPSK